VQVALAAPQVGIAAGSWHTCSWDGKGLGSCWGKGNYGQLGAGTKPAFSMTPLTIALGEDVAGISAGEDFTCAWRKQGWGVNCWGYGQGFRLGTGNSSDQVEPQPVVDFPAAIGATAGSQFACGLTPYGRARCWGVAEFMNLGTWAGGSWDSYAPYANSVVGTYKMLTAGATHVCGLRRDGSVACWGKAESGQIGDGKTWPKVCSAMPSVACVGEPSTVVGSDL
jgi:alpha-tubulin suppressor-like RCC1 family protein